ncbi:MAG: tetratricopeptide repeat protein [Myxococcota bacterium]
MSDLRLAISASLLLSIGLPGCIALKVDQDEIAADVQKLRTEVLAQQEAAKRNDELADELDSKLAEVEALLRRNQADLGLRVEGLEVDVQDLRGQAENADYTASAVRQELMENRQDVDERLVTLEEKLNEATNIPEGKKDLLAEAERLFAKRNYKQSRRLYRTYESRYPEDQQVALVRFKIGQTYFSERDYKSSLGEFYRVIEDSPQSDILPDALYYSGLAFAKIGQCQNAIAYFDHLRQKKTKAPQHYKDKAADQIKILKADKGDLCMDEQPTPGAAKKKSRKG